MRQLKVCNVLFNDLDSKNINFQLYRYEDIKLRDFELRRYRLLKFLDNELQFEVDSHSNLISNEINNKILSDNFQYNESNCRLYLHKKVDDYYILINFSYLVPRLDKKLMDELLNTQLKTYRDKIQNKPMFFKAIGLEDDADIKESSMMLLLLY